MKNVNVKKLELAEPEIFQDRWSFWKKEHLQFNIILASNTLNKGSTRKYFRIFLS